MKHVNSRRNPAFRSLERLKDSARTRRIDRVALLDGTHLVQAYLERIGRPQALIVAAGAADDPEIAKLLARAAPLEPVALSDGLFRGLSPVTTPTGILAVVPIPPAREVSRAADVCLLAEDIQDPGNLGAMLRTAAAAGVHDVLLSRGCADAWSPRVLRAAMGAHFELNIVERADLVAFARGFPGQVVATAARAERSIFDVDLARPTALVAGNEGTGISADLLAEADVVAAIPMPGRMESINVAAAAAVCLFERVRQSAMKRAAAPGP